MKKVIALACLSMLPLTYVAAEGYQVNAQSTKQAGMGHVGAAMKLGAESMHFNPAGMAFMDKHIHISAGVTGVFATATYEKDGYKSETNNPASTPLYIYASYKILDNLSAGISLTTPYGSTIQWDKNWKGSYLVQDISLKAFSLQPTLSYRILDNLSVGAGLMIDFGSVELSRALMQVGSLEPILGPAFADVVPAQATLNGTSDVRLGYNVGAMFDINEKFTIGASYRSKITMKVQEGTAVVEYASEAIKQAISAQVPPLDKGTFKAEMPMPSNFNLGLTYRPDPRWLVSGEVQFVGWGAYKKLEIQFTENVLNGYNISSPKNYKNTRIYRLGGQFAATSRLDLRLGAYYDEAPVRGDNFNPETPSMDKLGITAGCSFRPLSNLSVDLAFSYVTGFGRYGSCTDIDPLTKKERTFEGDYNVHAFMPAIGLSYAF